MSTASDILSGVVDSYNNDKATKEFFKLLYPSIMEQYDISPEKLVVCDTGVTLDFTSLYPNRIVYHDTDSTFIRRQERQERKDPCKKEKRQKKDV